MLAPPAAIFFFMTPDLLCKLGVPINARLLVPFSAVIIN
jgi:hypothetical protein